MQLSTTISSILVGLISIVTSCGVAIYDGQFVRVAAGTDGFHSTDAGTMVDSGASHSQHVHSDYNPLNSMLGNSFHYQSPSIAPRRRSHYKELLRTLEMGGGRHAFDDVYMPILS